MERISALIEKLRGQFAAGADIEQLLLTTQLLEGELRYHRQKGTIPASPHVAVLMPNNGNRLSEVHHAAKAPIMPNTSKQEPPRDAQRQEPQIQEPLIQDTQRQDRQRQETSRTNEPKPEHERYLPQKEVHKEAQKEPYTEVPKESQVTAPAQRDAPSREKTGERAREQEPIAFNPIKDVPTLTHQIPQEARSKEARRDLNEAIARENGLSLNESLKGKQRELSAVLTEAPIRDLRKAIGINDRYVFISELFRGDEIMYERSIKTINNFSIFQEAYYWMERELKLKLAWDVDKKSTQLFYQLVKRRFS